MAGAELTVRRADVEDIEALVPLFDAYRVFYQQASDPGAARAFLSARLERGESVVFLAEAGGEALGFTQLYPLFSSVRLSRVWLLNDLFVAEDARRRGVADALMAAAEAHARETGACGIQLETGVDNTSAQALYQRRGWTRESGMYHYHLLTGDPA